MTIKTEDSSYEFAVLYQQIKDRNKIFPDRRTVETILETLDRYKVECDQRGIDLDTGKAI